MPYYDFHCKDCAQTFEARLPVERRDDAQCPSCGGRNVKRSMPMVYAMVKGGPQPESTGECCGGGGGGCCGGACACAAEGRGAGRDR